MDKAVLRNKVKLANLLCGDPYILQHVHSREFITDSEYDMLKSISVPQEQVIKLLDIIYKKGEKVCGDFLEMLSEDDVNEFSPELRKWIKTVKNSDSADSADNVVTQTTTMTEPMMFIFEGQKNEGACCNFPRDCEVFLKEKKSHLVQYVKHIDLIVDDLGLHSESVGNIRAQSTDQNKMRKLLDYINSKTIAERLVVLLFKYEFDLMNDL